VLYTKSVRAAERILSKLQHCPKEDRGRISDLAPFSGSPVAIPLTDLQTPPTTGAERGRLPLRSSPSYMQMESKQRFCASVNNRVLNDVTKFAGEHVKIACTDVRLLVPGCLHMGARSCQFSTAARRTTMDTTLPYPSWGAGTGGPQLGSRSSKNQFLKLKGVQEGNAAGNAMDAVWASPLDASWDASAHPQREMLLTWETQVAFLVSTSSQPGENEP